MDAPQFDPKLERHLPPADLRYRRNLRNLGGVITFFGVGVIVLANHPYYNLSVTPAYVMRTYNQAWWFSRAITGVGVVMGGYNIYCRTNYAIQREAKALFIQNVGKKYPALKSLPKKTVLTRDDILALLMPSIKGDNHANFWTKQTAWKKQIDKVIDILDNAALAIRREKAIEHFQDTLLENAGDKYTYKLWNCWSGQGEFRKAYAAHNRTRLSEKKITYQVYCDLLGAGALRTLDSDNNAHKEQVQAWFEGLSYKKMLKAPEMRWLGLDKTGVNALIADQAEATASFTDFYDKHGIAPFTADIYIKPNGYNGIEHFDRKAKEFPKICKSFLRTYMDKPYNADLCSKFGIEDAEAFQEECAKVRKDEFNWWLGNYEASISFTAGTGKHGQGQVDRLWGRLSEVCKKYPEFADKMPKQKHKVLDDGCQGYTGAVSNWVMYTQE